MIAESMGGYNYMLTNNLFIGKSMGGIFSSFIVLITAPIGWLACGWIDFWLIVWTIDWLISSFFLRISWLIGGLSSDFINSI